MNVKAACNNRIRRHSGFTLIEALVSLIMFGVIMASLTFAFSTARKAQYGSEARLSDSGSVRVLIDALRRDFLNAYVSNTDPASILIGDTTSTSTGQWNVTSPGLLTISTSNYSIQADDLDNASGVMTSTQNTSQADIVPQSTLALVRYEFDASSRTVTRIVTAVPNPQLVTAPQPGDTSTILATDIVSLTIEYWDPTQNAWEPTWDYEQSNNSTSSTATGTTAATSAATQSSASTSSNSGSSNQNTTFPQAVQVTIVRTNSQGRNVTYTESFPIIPYTPFADPTTSGSTSGGTSGGTAAK